MNNIMKGLGMLVLGCILSSSAWVVQALTIEELESLNQSYGSFSDIINDAQDIDHFDLIDIDGIDTAMQIVSSGSFAFPSDPDTIFASPWFPNLGFRGSPRFIAYGMLQMSKLIGLSSVEAEPDINHFGYQFFSNLNSGSYTTCGNFCVIYQTGGWETAFAGDSSELLNPNSLRFGGASIISLDAVSGTNLSENDSISTLDYSYSSQCALCPMMSFAHESIHGLRYQWALGINCDNYKICIGSVTYDASNNKEFSAFLEEIDELETVGLIGYMAQIRLFTENRFRSIFGHDLRAAYAGATHATAQERLQRLMSGRTTGSQLGINELVMMGVIMAGLTKFY